ncbi:flagellar filament capping protein FliD [Paenibacillus lignilyticus]|uniref:Flagellar hook-associated protein 2 n=1 Tax=Paenibacillus lignilyticus TaxID=1172615 RepID=A0ABS5CLM7_9BACL|nr:flagellar filament capping protein FliD [Paenibacillus lignilyticus]MBP3966774.1 flagellar filament capping protein FliD [Paenibacillus lignilyticus]
MVMRLNGMASGMDIDTIVKQLMTAGKVPADKLKQQKQTVEWQRDAYKDLNKKLLDFRNNKVFNFKADRTLGAKLTTISGDNQVFTATARADAPIGTTSIKVMSLATSAKMTGTDIRQAPAVPTDPAFDASKTLEDQKALLKVTPNVGAGTDYSFKINGTQIDVDTSVDSLNDVISRINKTTNVNAFYDSFTGQIGFTTKATGTKADIKITDDTGGFAANILKMPAVSGTGQNALLEINGIATERESNSFTVNNMDIVLKQKSVFTGVAGQEADPTKYVATSIGVSTDTTKIVDSIKTFIADYNDVLKTLQDKVGEKKNRDFQPLTEEQRADMKEDDIKLWETKAKTGLLHNDSIFTTTIASLRTVTSTVVNTGNANYTTLSSIGIGSTNYLDNGKLSILDEEKLKTAIEKDPDAVLALFSAAGNGDADQSDVGIVQKMYGNLKGTLENLSSKAGTSLFSDEVLKSDSIMGKQLSKLNEQIAAWNRRLVDMEDNYYKKFTAMETAISKLNSQSSSLMSSIGG